MENAIFNSLGKFKRFKFTVKWIIMLGGALKQNYITIFKS